MLSILFGIFDTFGALVFLLLLVLFEVLILFF